MTGPEKKTILGLVSNGKTADAIEKLLSLEIPGKNRSVLEGIKTSFINLEKEVIQGSVSSEEETFGRQSINDQLVKFINDNDSAPTVSKRQPEKKRQKNVIIVITILASIATITGWNLKDLTEDDSVIDTFAVTIFVHGKKGKDQRLLKDQGQIMLGLRTNEMAGSINEKGETTFKEIPKGFLGQKVPIRLEHPQPYRLTNPDSLYLLEPNAAIFVEVALEGTDRVFGKVMDFRTEQWLDSVRVSINNVETYTDEFGWFELDIPEEKQRKFQKVSFYKKGYNIEEHDSIAVHLQDEMRISLKERN